MTLRQVSVKLFPDENGCPTNDLPLRNRCWGTHYLDLELPWSSVV